MPRIAARPASLLVVLLVAAVVAICGPIATPAAAAGSVFEFQGGGFGHGVGMSQFGARGQGDAGRSATQILTSYYPGTAVTSANPPGPTVLLSNSSCIGTAQAASTTVAPTGGSIVLSLGTPGGLAPITAIPSGGSVTVAAAGSGAYQISGGDNPGTYSGSFVMLTLGGVPTRLGMTDVRYKWGRLVLKSTGTALNAYAQDMTMDQYLYGLSEVPSSWPVETLKAQAIAGRTYAERVAAPRRASGGTFHVYGSTQDQCYRGYEKEAEGSVGQRWVGAVNGTAGSVLTYGGSLAQTFYSSSNGGYSERSDYVFAQSLPYLVAQPDPYDDATGNTLHRWTRTFDGDQLGAAIGGVGRVTSLSVSGNIGESGRLNRATIVVTGTTGSKTITGSTLKSALKLPDTLVLAILRDGTPLYGAAANRAPFGNFEAASGNPSGASVQGWAIDPDTSTSVEVHAYVNGAFASFGYANQSRPDVGSAYPYGSQRGFAFAVPTPVGTSSICLYAIDPQYANVSTGLGCRSTTRSNSPPFGNFDAAIRSPGGAILQGWAIDPDTTQSVEIHLWSDGRLVGYGVADQTRTDVGQAYPASGSSHGFTVAAALSAGTRSVCAYAINIPAGANTSLGCRTVEVSPTPVGNLDSVARSGNTFSMYGWAIDPDVSDPIEVHVLVDGVFAGWTYANRPRPDLAGAFPFYGSDHGFELSVAVTAGTHTTCAYAINAGAGSGNRLLGCRTG